MILVDARHYSGISLKVDWSLWQARVWPLESDSVASGRIVVGCRTLYALSLTDGSEALWTIPFQCALL